MKNMDTAQFAKALEQFHLPRYKELPGIDLYLDQIIQVVENSLDPVFVEPASKWITSSMVNNYTKQDIMKRPVAKKYNREHIASLMFICAMKKVMLISDIQKLLEIQRGTYSTEAAYNYFCTEFENALKDLFHGCHRKNTEVQENGDGEAKAETAETGAKQKTPEAVFLSIAAETVAQQIYLDRSLKMIYGNNGSKGGEKKVK